MTQARYWILTIPKDDYQQHTELPNTIQHIKGQQERGAGGFHHWQICVAFKRAVRLAAVKTEFGRTCHAEPTRSSAAGEYVWKEDTRIPDTQFELGHMAFKRNSKPDWDKVWDDAKRGKFDEIPANVRVNSYNALCRIAKDHMVAVGSSTRYQQTLESTPTTLYAESPKITWSPWEVRRDTSKR